MGRVFFFPVFKCQLSERLLKVQVVSLVNMGKVLLRVNELTFFWSAAQAWIFFFFFLSVQGKSEKRFDLTCDYNHYSMCVVFN